MTTTRRGKIARLPQRLRTELCRRLRDGQPGPIILDWINTQPEAQAILAAQFEGVAISPQNLSEWREGGYTEWLGHQDKTERIRSLAKLSMDLAQASGGDISAGSAAIAGGRLLSMIEAADEDQLTVLIDKVATLRSCEIAAGTLKLKTQRLAQQDRALHLAESKFRRETAEMFLKWYEDARAKEIAASASGKDIKTEKLVQLFFGDRPALKPLEA